MGCIIWVASRLVSFVGLCHQQSTVMSLLGNIASNVHPRSETIYTNAIYNQQTRQVLYILNLSKFEIISRPVIRDVAHSVGKSRVLEKVSA